MRHLMYVQNLVNFVYAPVAHLFWPAHRVRMRDHKPNTLYRGCVNNCLGDNYIANLSCLVFHECPSSAQLGLLCDHIIYRRLDGMSYIAYTTERILSARVIY